MGLKALELQVPHLPGICDLDEVLWKMIYSFWGGGAFVFLGPHLWHMEVPKLGVDLEQQLLA